VGGEVPQAPEPATATASHRQSDLSVFMVALLTG
jgi:hypothetical protein